MNCITTMLYGFPLAQGFSHRLNRNHQLKDVSCPSWKMVCLPLTIQVWVWKIIFIGFSPHELRNLYHTTKYTIGSYSLVWFSFNYLYSGPFISVGSTSADSINHRSKIFRKKFWYVPQSITWICCVLAAIYIVFTLF